MSITIPDDIFQSTGMSERELKLEIAVMLYQTEKLTLGNASRLAGMNQLNFQQLLASRNICIHYDVEDLQQDIQTLQALGKIWLNNLIIVSNTSPITSLAAVGQLDLLKQLYQRIIIPETVYQELIGANPTVPGAKEVSTFPWIETKIVANQPLVQALRQKLDPGEAAAIALAIALNADRLIIDERKGRKIAIDMGVQVIGILGVLLEAKSNGLIDRVKPIVDDLIAIAGFRISQQLYAEILQAAKESL